ncbi:hypothetical protein GGS20DRAFT_519918 [Poronia punctata]|nr:hypothetical protein GGS20DRAFT_519918 [Poronia punctata]
MNPQNSSRTRIFAIISFIGIFLYLFWTTTTTTITTNIMSDQNAITSSLKVAVRQASQDPPKLIISVTNTHSDPVTVFTWNSPLDSLAVQLGLVEFTPEDQENPIDIPTIQVRRLMPPKEDAFVTIEPGETEEKEILLREPVVPLGKIRGKKTKVVCKGEWKGVWDKKKGDVELKVLRNGEGALKGRYESEPAEVQF